MLISLLMHLNSKKIENQILTSLILNSKFTQIIIYQKPIQEPNAEMGTVNPFCTGIILMDAKQFNSAKITIYIYKFIKNNEFKNQLRRLDYFCQKHQQNNSFGLAKKCQIKKLIGFNAKILKNEDGECVKAEEISKVKQQFVKGGQIDILQWQSQSQIMWERIKSFCDWILKDQHRIHTTLMKFIETYLIMVNLKVKSTVQINEKSMGILNLRFSQHINRKS
ncbi:unnamed protein product [Paramecium octaurelia]|uniref:Uncharacterized protein n=1 Tax=Paramecium octaurelia TaxID=43137 RepID=A0A8S1YHL4_PAROT|nr:unnamed protein product [Paramecium octaurelia]